MIDLKVRVDKDWPKRYEKQLMRRIPPIIRAGAQMVRDEARRLAPVKTGALKASIYAIWGGAQGGLGYERASLAAAKRAAFGGYKYLHIGPPPVPQNAFEAYVVAGVHYAVFQEMGFRTRGGGFVAGKYFMSRAYINCLPIIRRMIQNAIREAERTARKPGGLIFA